MYLYARYYYTYIYTTVYTKWLTTRDRNEALFASFIGASPNEMTKQMTIGPTDEARKACGARGRTDEGPRRRMEREKNENKKKELRESEYISKKRERK